MASALVAGIAASTVLPFASASASTSTLTKESAVTVQPKTKTDYWTITTRTGESGTTGKFKLTRNGSIKVRIDKRQYPDYPLYMRARSCNNSRGMTDRQQIKMLPKGKYYDLKYHGKARIFAKGTCFKLEVLQSWAGKVEGHVQR
ncbi:MAG: hypothetical protein JWN52_1267 [Actinomycetia bacterium]|nr:hypothetical protein [Actinomycetes bacterium]